MSGVQGDGYTRAMITVDYAHHEIHDGSHFVISGNATIPINNVFDVQWTTPNTSSWPHLTWALTGTDVTTFEIWEGVTINLAGTALTPYNSNRNSKRTSDQVVKYIANSSEGNANADTATAAATKIWEGRIGSNQIKGATARNDAELILKQGTDYCFRAIGTAGTIIYFRMFWYEHISGKPLPL